MKTNFNSGRVRRRGHALAHTNLRRLVVFLMSTSLHAQDLSENRWWIHLGGVSYHINKDADRNGANYGLGLGYHLTESQSIRAGVFRNSYDHNAVILSYAWLPWKWGAMRFGANAVAASGYNNRTGALAAVVPWGEISWKYVGVEFGVVPVRNGIVTLQFKIRLD